MVFEAFAPRFALGKISRIRKLSSTASRLQREDGGGVADSLYRAIVGTAADAIVVIDGDGTIRSVNERPYGSSVMPPPNSSDATSRP